MINDLEIVQWDYLLDPAFQLVNTAGKPLTNGWIEVYIHGTRDKYYCASDFNGTLHPFQIPLDSLGSNIVLASPANAYDVYIYNVYGSLVMSRYNVKPGSGSGSGVIPADASYGIFVTNELPFNNTSNTGFQFTAKDIGGEDITFHEITYPYGRVDCKEGVYFYSATIEVSNTEISNESVKFQVLAGKNPNQSIYWLDFDNTYLHKQLYTICGIANFVNEDTFRINVSPYQLTNGVKASASQVAIHKLSTVVAGEGGGGGHEYGAGWGILINNNEISVDPSIIPTIEYVDASVSAVSSTLISTIESVSGNLQDQIDNIPAQVQADWNQTDDTEVDYIKNKPDLSVFATHDEVCAVSSVLQNEIDNIDTSEYVTHTELNSTVTAVSSVLENEIQIVSAAIPDVSDFVTHDEVSAVSSNLVEYIDNSIEEVNTTINNVSGDLVEYIDNSVGAVSGDIIEYVDNSINNVSGILESEIQIVSGAIPVVTGYATKDEVNTVSSTIINNLEVVSGAIQDTIESVSGILQDEIDNIPEQVNADWNAVSGKAEILNKPDLSVYATHDEVDNVSGAIIEYIDDSIDVVNNNVTAVSSVLNNKIDAVSAAVPDAQIQSDWNQTDNTKKDYIKNKPDLSHFVTDDELVDAVTSVSAVLETDIQVVSGALDELTAVVASASGIEYGQFYSTGITTTPATMARIKGTIAVDNGRIQLKKGSSYHVTVRGRYNQTTAVNTNSAVGYIEYVSNNTINVNVDKTLTDSQYFEISYDLFNLGNDVNYLVWFTGTDGGTVNDLWIEIHSLTGIGGQGGGTGPGTEYTPGYGIQILNNVISVSGIAPQVNSDWNAVSGVAEILNKPEEQALVAGDNINIQVSGSNVIISATGGGAAQVNSDWDAVSGVAEILNKPTEYDLIGGQNVTVTVSGTNVIIDAIGSVTGGSNVTTEEGQFTVHPNTEGADVTVIYPTDQAPDAVFYQIDSVTGNAYSNSTSNAVINYYYGETPADFNGSGDSILFTINDNISNIGSIYFYYTTDATGYGGPSLTTSIINGGETGIVQSGTYKLKAQYNQAGTSSSYGKYLQIMLNWRNYASDYAQSLQWAQEALSKISFFGVVRPDPTLGVTVNLDRYYLSNGVNSSTPNSDLACQVTVDPMSKQQKVYLPNTIPSSYRTDTSIAIEYGSNYNGPGYSNYRTKLYKAYKYTSSPRRYQFAYCTDWDYANSIMTFIAYDNSGNAIEKWTLNYSNWSSNVWTTTDITTDMSDYISYSASGVYLPNSKFEIDTNGQAYKVISTSTESAYNSWNGDGRFAYGNYYYNLPTANPDGTRTMRAGTYRFTVPSTANSIKVSVSGNTAAAYNGMIIPVTNHVADLIITEDLVFIPLEQGYDLIEISGYTNSDGSGDFVYLDSNNSSAVYIQSPVKEEYITESAIPEEINLIPGSGITIEVSGASAVISSTGGGGGGGSTYTAGNMIDITNNTISVETTAGITDIQLVNSLPATPTSTVLYLIPET